MKRYEQSLANGHNLSLNQITNYIHRSSDQVNSSKLIQIGEPACLHCLWPRPSDDSNLGDIYTRARRMAAGHESHRHEHGEHAHVDAALLKL